MLNYHKFSSFINYCKNNFTYRPRSANKIIREVQLLSLLHHPNIVAYKSAWLEYCSPPILQLVSDIKIKIYFRDLYL